MHPHRPFLNRACALFLLSAATAIALPAQTFTTLHSFDSTDGAYLYAGLVQGTDGNFYGTTYGGGANGDGTVFQITPGGTLTTLYSFCSQSGCTDGENPQAALVQGIDGNFYGTANAGGANGYGTVFQITPSGILTTLYSFCSQGTDRKGRCADGSGPLFAALVQGTSGSLYGTTPEGGAYCCGEVFQITPGGTLTTLYSFCNINCKDGANPEAGVIQGTDGNFYGTTCCGGTNTCIFDGSDELCGTFFKLTPAGTLTTLYNFCPQSGCTDGKVPEAPIVQGTDGNFYGTTDRDGANGYGTVFQITPSGILTTLYSFCSQSGCTDGKNPFHAGLLQGTDGNFYGTTMSGGAKGGGTVFQITPSGMLTTLYSFCSQKGCTDGKNPYSGLVQAANGNFYGTTYEGGASDACEGGCGTVFSLTPTPTAPMITSAGSATFTALAQGSFLATTTGYPIPALAESGTLPSGVTFTDNGNGTGTLAGTPANGTAGTYSITFTATNSAGSTNQSFTLAVDVGVGITSGTSTTFTVGSAGSFTVTTVGTPTPALSESGSLPSGVTFVDNGDGTGTLSGTPAAGTIGSYPITLNASNSIGSATQNFTLMVNEGPAITSGSSATFAVGAAGSFLVTTIGSPTPALSETGTLPSGVTFVDNGNGTATLSGTSAAGSGGSYTLTITAANGVGSNATQSFTLTINQSLAITSGSLTTFTVGSTGFFSVTATGLPVPALTESGSLPGGVTFTDNGNGTATLTGIPAADSGGSYPLTIDASNGGFEPDAIQSFTLIVNEGDAIITGNSTTFTVGVAGSFTVNATGTPIPALTETGALPAGVTFTDNGNGTGTLSGTPAAGSGGSYAITFNANNGVGTPAMQSFSLTVNQGPAITSANTASFTEQVAGSFTVTTTGDPTPALTETGSLPSGVTLVDNGDGTATLSGTPTAGTAGQYGFTIQASNGVLPNATQTFTLTVNGTVNVAVNTSPSGLSFTVDGATYTSSQTLTWTVGTSHTISTTSPQTPTTGTQFTFTSWSDGGALSDTVAASVGTTSYTASFSTSYQLTTAVNPTGGGTVSPPSGTYYPSGTAVSLLASANSGYAFTAWTGPVANVSSASTTVTMNAPESVTANFQTGPVTPTINWATPAPITYGTPVASKQLDATATYNGSTVGGTFVYTPPRGTVLGAGSQTLSVTFTPTNTKKYTTATGMVTLQVNQAAPKITWAKPAAITYGTALGSTQLDASASIPGSFVYSPPAGTVLTAGAQTLSVTFTPTDTTDYTTATHTLTFPVYRAVSTTAITSNTPNPSLIDQAVTVSFNVTGGGVDPTGGVGPTGSVTVTGGGQSCSAVLSAGAGSCSLTFTTTGSKTLRAKYVGDSNFTNGSSAAVTQTVQE